MLMARFRCCFVVEMGRFSIHPNEWVLEVIQPADTSVGRTLLLLRSGYVLPVLLLLLLLRRWLCDGVINPLKSSCAQTNQTRRHFGKRDMERSAKFPTCVAAWVLLCLAKSLMYVTFSEKRCFPVWLFYAVLPLP